MTVVPQNRWQRIPGGVWFYNTLYGSDQLWYQVITTRAALIATMIVIIITIIILCINICQLLYSYCHTSSAASSTTLPTKSATSTATAPTTTSGTTGSASSPTSTSATDGETVPVAINELVQTSQTRVQVALMAIACIIIVLDLTVAQWDLQRYISHASYRTVSITGILYSFVALSYNFSQ
jgi:hypothetical protein